MRQSRHFDIFLADKGHCLTEKAVFGFVALAMTCTLAGPLLPQALRAFADDEPRVEKQDRHGFTSEGAQELTAPAIGDAPDASAEDQSGPSISSRALDELINSVDLSIDVPVFTSNTTSAGETARRFSSKTYHSTDAYSFNYDEENARLTAILEGDIEPMSEEDSLVMSEEMEQYATALDEANTRIDELDVSIAEARANLKEINARLPEQEKASTEAARALYVMDQYTPSLVSVIMRSSDITEFLTNFEYLDRIREHILTQIKDTKELQTQAQDATAALEDAQDQMQMEREKAQSALAGTQESRMEAQRAAQAEVLRQANEVAAVASMVQQEAELKTSELAVAQSKVQIAREELAAQTTEEGIAQAQEALELAEAQEAEVKELLAALLKRTTDTYNTSDPMMLPTGELAGLSDDGVNWDVTKDQFVSEWTRRIDAYLAGTALAGYGQEFAEAAWTYGVDPRFSPAISNTESTNGKYCFLPYNAWGWGDVSWGSWEEAIDAHVRGLSQGYGYTLTASGARKYCPPNWENWYNNTAAQMNLI